MADKKSKSRALKAVNDTKKKTGNPTTSVKKKEPADSTSKKDVPMRGKAAPAQEPPIPVRTLGAAGAFILFVVFLFMGIKPDGALLRVLLSLMTGLVGKVGFYFAIPAMLYLFVILVSSKGQPVRMRSTCLILFVIFSSCVHHLIVNNQTFIGGFKCGLSVYSAKSELLASRCY